MTVKDSPKIKFMKANPNVSFLVDNKKIALECCGAMIQGKAKILSIAKMMATIYTIGPKSLLAWNKKYPGLLTFYAKGKDLPEERKLYKYRFIRIEPSKIVFWEGYKFGKYIPERKSNKEVQKDSLDPSNPESFANLLATVDEELETDEIPADPNWFNELNSAVSSGIISEDEKRVIGMYRQPIGVSDNVKPGELSSGERSLLKKWKASKGQE
jgi:general stress protein 26